MTLALKRIQPNYFDVIHDREVVGRIYRMIGDEELWRWMTTEPREPTEGPREEADKRCSRRVLRLMTPSRRAALGNIAAQQRSAR
jgi:hypothetical protein